MAAKKVYAVRKGKVIGILESWDACRGSVEGYPGAEYKGFQTLEEARAYMEGIPCAELPKGAERPRGMGDAAGGLVAYVDGSYEHSLGRYAFGCVFILPDDTVYVENGSGNDPDTARLRNVSGEMLGSMYAVRWAIKNGFSRIEIRYDYEGIEKWVTGAWKSKTELTRKYAESMRRWMGSVQMRFTKVAAHTHVYYNELADRLAKDGLTQREEIPKVWLMREREPWAE